MKIKIISDSTCDLSADLLQKYDIDIIPLIVMKDDQSTWTASPLPPPSSLPMWPPAAVCAPPPL